MQPLTAIVKIQDKRRWRSAQPLPRFVPCLILDFVAVLDQEPSAVLTKAVVLAQDHKLYVADLDDLIVLDEDVGSALDKAQVQYQAFEAARMKAEPPEFSQKP
jgi:hypothetical protein